MATIKFALPLCDDEIRIADDDYRDWLTCTCGRYYSRKTLNSYKQALDALFAADERAAQIEEFAANEDATRRLSVDGEGAVAPTAEPVAAQTNTDDYARDWELSTPSASAAASLNHAPVRVQPLRPRRALPKLTPQQTLLTVAASLLLIALSIFFGTTWNEPWFSLPLKAGVLAVIVAATAFGAIRSKKYFVIISNFLAALSAGFLALGLYAAAALGLFGDKTIADPNVSPYLAVVILVTGAYSTLMGRRFRVFGWLAVSPISVGLAGILSVSYFQQHELWPNFDATILSLTALLVYVVGRLTRITAPAELEVSKKSKKAAATEDSEDERENKYQIDLFDREQRALSNLIRISAGLSMALFALNVLSVLPLAVLQRTEGVSSIGFFVLAAFWLAASVVIDLRGANYIVADSVPLWAKRVSWNLGFAILAGSVLLSLRSSTTGINWLITIADAVIGAVLLFAIPSKLAQKFEASLLASQISAGLVWAIYVLLAAVHGELDSTLFASWLSIVAAALFVKAWLIKQRIFALLAALAGNVAAVSLVLMQTGDNSAVLVSFAIAFVLGSVWFVATRVLDSRLKSEAGFGPWIYLGANVALALGLIAHWDASGDNWMILAVAAVLSAALAWLEHSKLARANEKRPLVLVALLWSVSGFAILAKGSYEPNHAVWSVYALVVFAIALFELAKSKLVSSMFAGIIFGSLATILTARWSLDATVASHIVNPAVFLALAVITSMLVHRVGKTSSRELNLAASASFVASWATFMTYKVQLTAGWSDSDASGNSILTVAVFAIFATALLLLRLREPVKKNLSLFFGVAGVTSLLGSLLAASSVSRTWMSLLLITFTLVLAFALSYVTARSLKSSIWFWAAYALALSSIASTQATILAGQSGAVLNTWLSLILPITLALTLVLHTLMSSASKATGTKFGWQILPGVSVGAAVLALATPMFAGYYSTSAIAGAPGGQWTTIIGFSVLAALYLGLRLRSKSSDESARALLSTSAIALVLGLVGLFQAAEADLQIQLATIMGVYALLLIAQALVRRELRTNFYGSGLLIASAWLLINKFTIDATFGLAEYYSVFGAAVFLLSSWLIKRTETKLDLTAWRSVLPAVYLVGTVIGISQFTGQSFASNWIQVVLADAIGLAAFFGSRVKFDLDAKARVRALRAVGVISWALALYVSLNDNGAEDWLYEGQLLREVIIGVTVSATMLVFARLERSRAFVIAGYATSVLAGSVTGGYLNFVVSFDVPELFTAAIAVALLAAGLVASSVDVISAKWRSMAVYGAPLLTIGVPSAVFAWATVAQPIASLDGGQLTRVLALAIGGAILVVLGVRLGNLGLTVAGVAPLALTLVPNVWFRIEDAFSGRTQLEIKALFVGLVLYGALRSIFAALKTSMKSIVYVGIPVVIAIGPAMLDALSALSQPTLTSEDWIRFGIVLGGSLLLLVIGALRKLGGLFVPGAVGVIISALPYAWAQISSQNWALWVVLILVATLLVLVAIRLEQFKNGARSASNWMRELR